MTTASVPLPARVAAVLATASTWTAGRRKSDNKPFFFVPGSNGAVYMTATDGCTCPAARRGRTGDCKHQAAVRQHAVTRTARPAPATALGKYEVLFPSCQGCGDIAEGKDGLCYRCSSEREWQQRRESARAHVAAQIAAGTVFADALNPLAE